MLYPETDYYKPQTRAECVDGPRPCPYVSCKHHLYLDVRRRGGPARSSSNSPDLEGLGDEQGRARSTSPIGAARRSRTWGRS